MQQQSQLDDNYRIKLAGIKESLGFKLPNLLWENATAKLASKSVL